MDWSSDGVWRDYTLFRKSNPEMFRPAPNGISILRKSDEIRSAQAAVGRERTHAGHATSDLRVGLLATDPYMTVLRDAVRFPDGSVGLHNRIIEGRSIAVPPMLEDRVVLIRIFRHGLQDWSLEFPRGGVASGESAPAAARRELKEEIEANTHELIDLGPFTPGGSSLSIRSQLYFAQIDGTGEPQRSEGINEIVLLDCAEFEARISDGTIFDGFSLSLFARAPIRNLL